MSSRPGQASGGQGGVMLTAIAAFGNGFTAGMKLLLLEGRGITTISMQKAPQASTHNVP